MEKPTQPSLFDNAYGPGARNTDPDTSHKAAAERSRKTDRWRALVVHSYHRAGLTDYELAELMHRQQNSAGKRRHEWTLKGGATASFIEDSGQRRPAPSGSSAIVWRITEAGIKEAQP